MLFPSLMESRRVSLAQPCFSSQARYSIAHAGIVTPAG
jgi:hypothetical protein